jgi:hypothetical protein
VRGLGYIVFVPNCHTSEERMDGSCSFLICQEEAMLLPTEVAIILHPDGRTMQFAVAPAESPASHQ